MGNHQSGGNYTTNNYTIQYTTHGNSSNKPVLSTKVDESLKFDADIPIELNGLNPTEVDTSSSYSELVGDEVIPEGSYDGKFGDFVSKVQTGYRGTVRFLSKHRSTMDKCNTVIGNMITDLESLSGGNEFLPGQSHKPMRDFTEYSETLEQKMSGIPSDKVVFDTFDKLSLRDDDFFEPDDSEIYDSNFDAYDDDGGFGVSYDGANDVDLTKRFLLMRRDRRLTPKKENGSTALVPVRGYTSSGVSAVPSRIVSKIKVDDIDSGKVGVGLKTLQHSVGDGLVSAGNVTGISKSADADVGGAIFQTRLVRVIPTHQKLLRIRKLVPDWLLKRVGVNLSLRGSEYGISRFVVDASGKKSYLNNATSTTGVITQMIGNRKCLYGRLHEVRSKIDMVKNFFATFDQDLFIVPAENIGYYQFHSSRMEHCGFYDCFERINNDFSLFNGKPTIHGVESLSGSNKLFASVMISGSKFEIVFCGYKYSLKNFLYDVVKNQHRCDGNVRFTIKVIVLKKTDDGTTLPVAVPPLMSCGLERRFGTKVSFICGHRVTSGSNGDSDRESIWQVEMDLTSVLPGSKCEGGYSVRPGIVFPEGYDHKDLSFAMFFEAPIVTLIHVRSSCYYVHNGEASGDKALYYFVGLVDAADSKTNLLNDVNIVWLNYIEPLLVFIPSIIHGLKTNLYPTTVIRYIPMLLKCNVLTGNPDVVSVSTVLVSFYSQIKFWMLRDTSKNLLAGIASVRDRRYLSISLLMSACQLIKDYPFREKHSIREEKFKSSVEALVRRVANWENDF